MNTDWRLYAFTFDIDSNMEDVLLRLYVRVLSWLLNNWSMLLILAAFVDLSIVMCAVIMYWQILHGQALLETRCMCQAWRHGGILINYHDLCKARLPWRSANNWRLLGEKGKTKCKLSLPWRQVNAMIPLLCPPDLLYLNRSSGFTPVSHLGGTVTQY